ncbi:MAG: SpoIID/LytB domain-containing protein [Patescibacteria group bacterium]
MSSAWRIGLSAVFIVSSFAPALSASAAPYKGYDGTVSDATVALGMHLGDVRTIMLTYKNVGQTTWTRGTKNGQVSLYVVSGGPSVFQDKSWYDKETPATIANASVKSGKSTTVTLRLKASKIGTYTEVFRLAANNVAWMRGAETAITVKIVPVNQKTSIPDVLAPSTGSPSSPSSNSAPAVPATTVSGTTSNSVAPSGADSYSGILILRSQKQLSLPGGSAATVTYGFKNTGGTTWNQLGLQLSMVQAAMNGAPNTTVYDSSWKTATQPVLADTATKPGEIGFVSFTMRAPPKRGDYKVRFALVADNNTPVSGAYVDIPVTVTADGAIQVTPPITAPTQTASPSASGIQMSPNAVGQEPILRVGIFATTDDRMQVRGVTGGYRIYQKTQPDKTICSFTKDQVVTFSFDRTNLVYKIDGPGCVGQSTTPYEAQSTVSQWDPLEMADFNRPVSWLPGANDNTFRGILELRYAADDSDHGVWAINELPMEMYLKGLGETSDSSPLEYQKALLTGARTYAYYHWVRGTKHAAQGFHVDAKYDQVYRGYGVEARSPNIVAGVDGTRGQIVTYNSALAITPYFSRSDGHTRNWGDVWGGGSNYPWLVSVPVPEDIGKTLWGHGVGMSATGAIGMAVKGIGYQDILTHFYTGTSLMQFYQ